VGQLYLHQAMVQVLEEAGGGWMDRDELARRIADQDLYRRKDGSPARATRCACAPTSGPTSSSAATRAAPVSALRNRSTSMATDANVGESEPRPVKAASEDQADADDVTAWYEELRQRYRPGEVEVLLIAESPPDPGAGRRRFFYSPELSQHDNLYRGVAQALYGEERDFGPQDKPAVLDRIQADGYWLIDSVERPINKTSPSARRAAISAGVARLVERCKEVDPRRGVIICHTLIYELVAPSLQGAGIQILHDQPLPFPLGNWRAQFIDGFRQRLG
jgi:hypothetical protein